MILCILGMPCIVTLDGTVDPCVCVCVCRPISDFFPLPCQWGSDHALSKDKAYINELCAHVPSTEC